MAIRSLLTVFMLMMIGCGNKLDEGNKVHKGFTEAERTERAIKRLNAASRWLIENGIAELLTNPSYDEKLNRTMIDKFLVIPAIKPGLDSPGDLARFAPKSYGIVYDINSLKRNRYNGSIYEYWMIFSSGREWSNYEEDCQFFITKSDSIKSRREIIKESGQFFHQYVENDAVVISLDYENDLYIRYILRPWLVPHCYKHYAHITQKKLIPVGNGKYSFGPK